MGISAPFASSSSDSMGISMWHVGKATSDYQ